MVFTFRVLYKQEGKRPMLPARWPGSTDPPSLDLKISLSVHRESTRQPLCRHEPRRQGGSTERLGGETPTPIRVWRAKFRQDQAERESVDLG